MKLETVGYVHDHEAVKTPFHALSLPCPHAHHHYMIYTYLISDP